MRNAITAVGVLALIAGAAAGQASRDVAKTDAAGARVQRETVPLLLQAADGPSAREGLLWTYVDPVSITESVSLGDAGTDSWVAHVLNDERVSKFTTTGDGTPDFVIGLQTENPFMIGVSCAADVSLCGVILSPTGLPIRVQGHSETGGETPLWTYDFPAGFTSAGKHNVDVNADGTRVAVAAANSSSQSIIAVLDGEGNQLNSVQISGFVSGVELSGNGTLLLATVADFARLYDAATLTEIYALQVSGAGGYHRISRDGTAIAAGGFDIKAARKTNGNWEIVYQGGGSQDWFGWGVALSGDGQTLFVLSHDYGQNYLRNDHRVVDLTTGTVIADQGYLGSGGFQNSAVGAQANEDGTLFVAASWGDQANTQPEVRIYDRTLNLVGTIDPPGSPFDVDMTPDGRYVLVGSKAVHANTFGNGGRTYAYETAAECYADFNGDDVVDTRDVLAFLNAWTAQDPASDCDGNGTIDTRDVLCFLNLWTAGC